MSHRNCHFRPSLESLEGRKLMAGDVVAALEGSFLRVEGDNLDNQITISQTLQGDVIVAGQNGTRINGLTAVRFVRPQLNAMEVRMEGGQDLVSLRGLTIANDLFVDLGAGNDRLTTPTTSPVTVGANAMLMGSEGNDTVQLSALTVREDLMIDGGLGALNASLNGVNVEKALSVFGDDAVDVITVNNSRADLGMSIETKGAADRVSLTDVTAFALSVNTDANGSIGADQVNLTRVTTQEDLGIFTGAGNDVVRMTDTRSNKSIVVSLDDGDDRLVATRVSAAVDAIFEGGAGFDILDNFGITAGITRDLKEFEVIR